jgi:hypothetical protein
LKQIPLEGKNAHGRFALVDDEDYGLVSAFRWSAHVRRSNGREWVYAVSQTGGRRWMHDLIMGENCLPSVDHISGDTLDNRRSNLRTATQKEQMRNRQPNRQHAGKPRLTRFKGVQPDKSCPTLRWRARITVDGRRLNLGSYLTDTDAAKAYNEAAQKYFGEFARLNAA